MSRRICFFLNSAGGGATLSAIDLMKGLQDKGWDFYAISGPGGTIEEKRALKAVVQDFREIPLAWWNKKYNLAVWKRVAHWGWGMVRTLGRIGSVARIVTTLRHWDIDVVHSNTSLTPDAALAARWLGLPHIWHLREWMGREGLFKFWLPDRWMALMISFLSNRVVANSKTTAIFMEKSGIHPQILVNAVEVQRIANARPRGEALRRSWFGETDHLVVGMVANIFSAWKGHQIFLRAAALIAETAIDVRFVVVGTDPAQEGGYRGAVAYADSLRTLSKTLGIEQIVHWAGFQEDIPAVMQALDVLVHPSGHESFGRVAVEAMAASKPVVAAGTGGLAEIVIPGVTGFLAKGIQPKDYASPIQELLESSELRHEMGQAGFRRVQEEYSIEKLIEGVDALYREVIGERRT